MRFPRATVRLQMHRGFSFEDAAETVDYYAELGISHFYLSPIFAAREGSTHGYDVVDPTRVNPELGGREGLVHLVARLRAAGMGLIIDIVPNHMGVATDANPYWQDVLARGADSAYASWFDIDWASENPRLKGKLLLPVLGDFYEKVLASGELELVFDEGAGRLKLRCYDKLLPLSEESLSTILSGAVSPTTGTAEAVSAVLARFRPSDAKGVQRLHQLLEQQHYRLSWWRNAAEEINWRRFFEVSELAGVRVEMPEIFEATHALVFDLYQCGLIDGVRVDHVDGLANPEAYCQQLRARLAGLQGLRPKPLANDAAWIVVEKILSPGEQLPASWNVDGSTGYDFMEQAGAVLHDEAGELTLKNLWRTLTGDMLDLDSHVQQAREQLLAENFGGEFDAVALCVYRFQQSLSPAGRDVSLHAIRRVLGAFMASFRPYRTYITGNAMSAADANALQGVTKAALAHLRLHDHALLGMLPDWLGPGEVAADPETSALRARAITRFQQLTPPLAAKSVEDTVFYRYAPLLSRNEVGSYPAGPTGGVAAFHNANLARAAGCPASMLATATHDHKRGEDVRARLAVLADVPDAWAYTVQGWQAAHRELRTVFGTPAGIRIEAPDAIDEFILYQTVLGAWPLQLQADDQKGIEALATRITAWQQKALREAKRHSSWMMPSKEYEDACEEFAMALLCTDRGTRFRSELVQWLHSISPAASYNALTQTVLRLTSPGIPDLYQGTELDDFSLVDPDNRRPVDMARRRQALLRKDEGTRLWCADLGAGSKQIIIKKILALRERHATLFCGGSYRPLDTSGGLKDHVVAFARASGDVTAVTIALRTPGMLEGHGRKTSWKETFVQIPEEVSDCQWTNVLNGAVINPADNRFDLAECWVDGPVAVLVNESQTARH